MRKSDEIFFVEEIHRARSKLAILAFLYPREIKRERVSMRNSAASIKIPSNHGQLRKKKMFFPLKPGRCKPRSIPIAIYIFTYVRTINPLKY